MCFFVCNNYTVLDQESESGRGSTSDNSPFDLEAGGLNDDDDDEHGEYENSYLNQQHVRVIPTPSLIEAEKEASRDS